MSIFYQPPFFKKADHVPNRARDEKDIVGVILHTTGYGPGVVAIDKKRARESERTTAYAERLSRLLEYKGHFLVGRDGIIFPIVLPQFTAYHTGSNKKNIYKRTNWLDTKNDLGSKVDANWWASRNLGSSPIKLPVWSTGSPNSLSIGVDVLAVPPDQKFGKVQLDGVVECLVQIAARLGFNSRPSRRWVWTHSEVCPLSRTDKNGLPYDLSDAFDLEYVLNAVDIRNGLLPSNGSDIRDKLVE